RKKSGYTQHELAKMLKSNQARIAKMENGYSGISLDFIFKSLIRLKTPKSKISKVLA
ncbi:helix-turn-helix domain-containing protein, partial [candidate division KSB1 bacterium]